MPRRRLPVILAFPPVVPVAGTFGLMPARRYPGGSLSALVEGLLVFLPSTPWLAG